MVVALTCQVSCPALVRIKVILAGHKKDQSPYSDALYMKGIGVYQKLSPVISSEYLMHSTALTEDTMKRNFEFYKNDPQIASVDALTCHFPPAMCELWMPYNKTIVYAPAHRYNLDRCSKEEWGRLDEHLYTLAAMDSPRHVIAALSVYDYEYLRHYTGLDPIPLFASSLFYTANNPYNPTRDEILVFDWLDGFGTDIQKFTLKDVRTLYPRYQLSDLVKHRAVVYMPHSVMGYAMTELYSLALPLFMPSMKFMQTIKPLGPDRSSLSAYYCKKPDKDINPHPCSLHPYSPNVEAKDDPEAEYILLDAVCRLLPVTSPSLLWPWSEGYQIWRSYFAQRFFWEVGLHFGFLARPLVVQDRNDHSYLGDLNAEQDLYMKSKQLVQFLGEWKGKGATLVERMEELWIAVYKRAYIDLQDVELMQLWVESLLDAGYEFISLVSSPATAPSNVVTARVDTEDDESSYDEVKSLTLWTSDLHDGSRIDMPSLLSSLGQN